jgi:hypothetical protein
MGGSQKKLLKENKEFTENVYRGNFKKSDEKQMPTNFAGWTELGAKHDVHKLPSDTDDSFIARVRMAAI